MDDKKRENDELLEQILQEAHSLRDSRKNRHTSESAAGQPAPVKEPQAPAAPATEPSPPEAPQQEPPSRQPARESRWKRFLNRRKRRQEEEPDETEDIYYGLQLKPIEEYQRGLEEPEEHPIDENHPTDEYSFLFDNTPESELDEEIASRFRELHRERQRRVEEALEAQGLNFHQVATELGVIRPLPKKTGIDHGKEIFSVTPKAEVHTETPPETPAPPPEPPKPKGTSEKSDRPQTTEAAESQPEKAPVSQKAEPAVPDEPTPKPSSGSPQEPMTVDAILEQVRKKRREQAAASKEKAAEPAPTGEILPIADYLAAQKEKAAAPAKPKHLAEEPSKHEEAHAQAESPAKPKHLAEEPSKHEEAHAQAESPAKPKHLAEEPSKHEEAHAQAESPAKPKHLAEEPSKHEEAHAQAESPAKPKHLAEEPSKHEEAHAQAESPAKPKHLAEEPSKHEEAHAQAESPAKPKHMAEEPQKHKDSAPGKEAAKTPAGKKEFHSSWIPSIRSHGEKHPEKPKEPEESVSANNPFVDESPRQPKMPREAREGPSYAAHSKPVHLMDLDVLDFALREESRCYEEELLRKKEAEAQRRRKKHEKMKRKKAAQSGFSLRGDEPEEEAAEPAAPSQEELEDFNDPSDAASVSHDLRASMRELTLRVLVTGLCTGLLGLFGLMGEFTNLFPWHFSEETTGTVYMTLNLIFLVISIGFCMRMIWSGLKFLFRFKANSDSGLALAAAAALIQAICACVFPEQIMSGSLHLYSVLASGGLFLNSLGKLVMIRRIWNNFRFVASREAKFAVQLYDDYNTSLKLAKNCVLGTPVIAYQQKAGFLTRFLQHSYEPDPLETNSQNLAPIGLIASLALCIASLLISHSATEAVSAFTASACICVPFTGLLGGNVLLRKLSQLGKRCGAMAVGYPAVEKFSNVNAVMLDAQDLFPKGTIVLNGIKTFGAQRIDEAILKATALMCAAGGPLVSVFDQIIKTRREILPRTDKPVYENGRGVTGWVGGQKVLIGNRDLLAAHHIDPPSHEFEDKYTAGGKKIAYLAVGGQLVAMFLLTYRRDIHRVRELQRMEENGISLIVRTCDPNITAPFLAHCFGLDPRSIQVLSANLGEEFVRVTSEPCERTPALLATRGRPVSLLRMLSACVRTRSNLSLATAMQTVAVVLGFVLVAFLGCYSGLQQLSTLSLVLYEVFWCFVILFFPRLHKP